MQRRALIVGIDEYRDGALSGAVADARAISQMLAQNADSSSNYECKLLLGKVGEPPKVTRSVLRNALKELFTTFRGDTLFYFSGHGVDDGPGFLITQDYEVGDWGVSMDELLQMANECEANDSILILDCCFSGKLGNSPMFRTSKGRALSVTRENLTILAASLQEQTAAEAGGHGLFTASILNALDGGAADPMGNVSAASIYAYVDRRFGAWEQRPVYKAHTTTVSIVRQCQPLIDKADVRKLTSFFPNIASQFQLDPEYEPEDEQGQMHEPINNQKIEVARLFKQYRDAGLIRPVEKGEQLYWTARHNHSIELTPRGKEYWQLVYERRI